MATGSSLGDTGISASGCDEDDDGVFGVSEVSGSNDDLRLPSDSENFDLDFLVFLLIFFCVDILEYLTDNRVYTVYKKNV